MRTKEACATRLTFIIAMIVSAAIAVWLPAVPAHAVTGSVTARGVTCNFGTAAATSVTLPASCGGVSITAKPGTAGAQAAALLISGSQNQVVIRNAVITNKGPGGVTVTITATHLFGSVVVNSTAQRSYAVGMSASFSRKNASQVLVLATGNSISKQGFYTYPCSGCTDQIGGGVGGGSTLSYGVPTSGSTTANTIPIPAPSASESPRNCSSFNKVCNQNGETLKTTLSVTLSQVNDLVTISGGDHTIAGPAATGGAPGAFVEAVLGSLTPVLGLQQNTPSPKINPNDKGFLTVNLFCNPDFQCENVDLGSLTFGPAHAPPKSTRLVDIDKDGNVDLQVKFAQQDTGITCSDVNATLAGQSNFPGFGLLDFDATVGFYTDPSCP